MMRDGFVSGDGMMWGWGGMFFGPLMMVGVLALLVFVIVMIVKAAGGGASDAQSVEAPLDILKCRLAAGEVDEIEYGNLKKRILIK